MKIKISYSNEHIALNGIEFGPIVEKESATIIGHFLSGSTIQELRETLKKISPSNPANWNKTDREEIISAVEKMRKTNIDWKNDRFGRFFEDFFGDRL